MQFAAYQITVAVHFFINYESHFPPHTIQDIHFVESLELNYVCCFEPDVIDVNVNHAIVITKSIDNLRITNKIFLQPGAGTLAHLNGFIWIR